MFYHNLRKWRQEGMICVLTTEGTQDREGYRYPEVSLKSISILRKRWPSDLCRSQPMDGDASEHSPGPKVSPHRHVLPGTIIVTLLV